MNPMLRIGRFTAVSIAATCVLAAPALAQRDKMTPVPTPAQPNAIELGTGPLPGATASESWHRQYGSLFARHPVAGFSQCEQVARRILVAHGLAMQGCNRRRGVALIGVRQIAPPQHGQRGLA